MRTLGASLAMAICLVAGFGVGFKSALAYEHARLDRNKEILRRVHKEVWSNANVSDALRVADELYSANYALHDFTGDSQDGINGVKEGLLEQRMAFPDWNEQILDIVAERDLVLTRFVSTGTQKGDLAAIPGIIPGLPATGKVLRMPEMSLHRIVGGKIAEQWGFADIWGSAIQLGQLDPNHICPESDPSATVSGIPAARPTPAESDSTLLRLIMANEYKLVATLQRNDIDAFARMLPEDIIDIDEEGIHSKSELVKEFRIQKEDGFRFKDFKFEEPRLIRLGPDAAIMFCKETWHAADKGKPVEGRTYLHGLYVRRAGTWVPRFYQDTIAQKAD